MENITERSTREIIKENITALIIERDITPVALSKKVGISFTAIYDWLKGKKAPTLDTIDKLCVALDCQRSDILIDHSNSEDISENRFHGRKMKDDEMTLLEAYDQLSEVNKVEVIRSMVGRLSKKANKKI